MSKDALLQKTDGTMVQDDDGTLRMGDDNDPCCCKRCLYHYVWLGCPWTYSAGDSSVVCTDVLPPVEDRDRYIRTGNRIDFWHVGDPCEVDGDCPSGTIPDTPSSVTYPCEDLVCVYTLLAECTPGANGDNFVITSVAKDCIDPATAGEAGTWIRDSDTTAHLIVIDGACADVGDCPDLTGEGYEVGDKIMADGWNCEPCLDENLCPDWPRVTGCRWSMHYVMTKTADEDGSCAAPTSVDTLLVNEKYPDLAFINCHATWAEFYVSDGNYSTTPGYTVGATHPWSFIWGADLIEADGDCAGFTCTRTRYNPIMGCTMVETWTFVIET